MTNSVDLNQAVQGTPVAPDTLRKLIALESGGDPNARNKASGAFGLGQTLPSTAADPGYGLKPLPPDATPQQQAQFAADYLAARGKALGLSSEDWKNPEKVKLALAAYHGPQKDANGITGQEYANRILGGGDAASSLGAQSAMQALGLSPHLSPQQTQNLQQIHELNQQKEQRLSQIYQEVEHNYRRDQEALDRSAKSYQPIHQTPPPKAPDINPFEGFGSAASLFAVLASAFTHTPAINAMNGMAAAINATKKGDQEGYDRAYQQWKTNTELAIQNHKLQAEDLRNAIDTMRDNLSAGVAMAKAVAAQSGDAVTDKMLENGEYDKLYDVAQKRDEAAQRMAENMPKVSASLNLMQAERSGDPAAIEKARAEYSYAHNPSANVKVGTPLVAEVKGSDGKPQFVLAQQMPNGQWVTADEHRHPIEGVQSVVKPDQAPPANDANVSKVAQAIADYRMPPLSGWVLKSPFGQAVLAKITEINPNYEATEYQARSKAARDFSTGKQGQAINSFNVAISHLDTLGELADALENKNAPAINKIANAFSTQTGGIAPTNFNAAKQIVSQEVIKSILAGGGSLAERQEAENNINATQTPAQLRGVIDTYKTLMAGQLRGLRQQYEQTTGLKDFDSRLSPEARKQLENEAGKKDGSPPVAGARKAPDGKWYVPDPERPGKYLRVDQ